jgi:hypothetical protein
MASLCPVPYRSVPVPRGASREQAREHWGSGPVRSRTSSALRSSAIRDRIGRPGTARPITAFRRMAPVRRERRCFALWRLSEEEATGVGCCLVST